MEFINETVLPFLTMTIWTVPFGWPLIGGFAIQAWMVGGLAVVLFFLLRPKKGKKKSKGSGNAQVKKDFVKLYRRATVKQFRGAVLWGALAFVLVLWVLRSDTVSDYLAAVNDNWALTWRLNLFIAAVGAYLFLLYWGAHRHPTHGGISAQALWDVGKSLTAGFAGYAYGLLFAANQIRFSVDERRARLPWEGSFGAFDWTAFAVVTVVFGFFFLHGHIYDDDMKNFRKKNSWGEMIRIYTSAWIIAGAVGYWLVKIQPKLGAAGPQDIWSIVLPSLVMMALVVAGVIAIRHFFGGWRLAGKTREYSKASPEMFQKAGNGH